MSKFENPLNNITIASPCQADWDAMYGDSRKRFCGDCKLNVYNLSGMTRGEAESLIQNAEGRLCVRFFQRQDGTVLTADCPVGWAKLKQRSRTVAKATISMIIALFTGVFFVSLFAKPKATIGDLIIPFSTPTPMPMMGAVAIRPTTDRFDRPVDQAVMGRIAISPSPKKKMRDARSSD